MSRLFHHALTSQYKISEAHGEGKLTYVSAANCITPEVVIYGKCIQNGTPTPDTPIIIEANNNQYKCHGKNMFRSENNVDMSTTVCGLKCTYIASSGIITIKGSVTGVSSYTNTTYHAFDVMKRHSEKIIDDGYTTLYSEILSKEAYELTGHIRAVVYSPSSNKIMTNVILDEVSTTLNTNDNYSCGFYISIPLNSTDEGKKVDVSFRVMYVEGQYTADTIPPYEPYFNGGIITVPELYSVGDVRDEYYPKSGKIVRRCKKLVFETLKFSPVSVYTLSGRNGISIGNILDGSYTSGAGICSHESVIGFDTTSPRILRFGANNRYIYWIGILDALGMTTRDEFVTWIDEQNAAGTPLTVVYALNEPVVEYVAPIKLTSKRGANSITESGSMSGTEIDVKYLAHS